jgi:hypothetical protein
MKNDLTYLWQRSLSVVGMASAVMGRRYNFVFFSFHGAFSGYRGCGAG